MRDSQKRRISTIRRKHGPDSFRSWGRRGGSPVLKAWAKGRLRYV